VLNKLVFSVELLKTVVEETFEDGVIVDEEVLLG
jgi:hypothetical protein